MPEFKQINQIIKHCAYIQKIEFIMYDKQQTHVHDHLYLIYPGTSLATLNVLYGA